MTKGTKTYDDFCADQRKIELDKKILSTPIGNVLERNTTDLFEEDWKDCPEELKDYIESCDLSDYYYANATTFVEDFLLLECQISDELYDNIMNWLQGIKVLVYFPER